MRGHCAGLQVVLNARSPDMETVYGVRLPAKVCALLRTHIYMSGASGISTCF